MTTKFLRRAALVCAAIVLAASPVLAGEGQFVTHIIRSNHGPYSVAVPANRVLTVINFLQDVAVPDPDPNVYSKPPAVLKVTLNGEPAVPVLSAFYASYSQNQKNFVVKGPATVTVGPEPGANLFLTFRIERD